MAQTGNFTPILLYGSSTPGNVPLAANLTNSTTGSEIAINVADGKLFYKDSSNAVQVIGWKTTPTTAGGTGLTSYTAGDMTYWASGTTFTKLGIGTVGQVLTSTGTAPQWATLSSSAVTTLSFGTTGLTPSSATSGAITVAGTLVAANGGTGQSSYAVGDILYASTTTALSKLADVATGNALISGGVGVAPSYGKIGLTTHISGTLAVGNGGTGLTTLTANYIPYGNGTSAFSSSANLLFNGTNLAVGGSFTTTVSSGIAINNATAGNYPGLEIQTAGVTRLFFNANNAASYISSVSTNPLVIQTNGVETMRLDSSNNVLVGTTTSAGKLTVNGTGTALAVQGTGAGVISQIGTTDTAGNPYLQLYLTDTSTNRGSVQYNRGTGFMLYNTTSDARLKKNILPVGEVGDIIDQIQIVSHDWKDSNAHSDYSVIAQDLQPIVPQAVSKGDDGAEISELWQVDHSKLVPLLVKEIQSLRARLKTANIA